VARRVPGHYVEHHKPPIPITVHVDWVDGGEGDLDGWISQWTRTHVCDARPRTGPVPAVLGTRSDVQGR